MHTLSQKVLNWKIWGTSLAVQQLGLCLPMQGMWIQSLVGKLRSHMPIGKTPAYKQQKQYCNKFNKDFKMAHIKKHLEKKQEKFKIIIDVHKVVRNGTEISVDSTKFLPMAMSYKAILQYPNWETDTDAVHPSRADSPILQTHVCACIYFYIILSTLLKFCHVSRVVFPPSQSRYRVPSQGLFPLPFCNFDSPPSNTNPP